MTTENFLRTLLTDVLVIGAGPSGLMAAQALARLGVSTLVVDRRERGTQYGNADGFQPRTLEIWQSYGLREIVSAHSACLHAMVGYERREDGGGLVRSLPIRNVVVDTRYPFELTASIDTIEETLRDSLEAAGARIIQPALPLSIDILAKDSGSAEVSHPVKVVLQHLPCGQGSPGAQTFSDTRVSVIDHPDIEVVHAKYVIGADGAYSWVRRQLDIKMEGDQTEYVWGVADMTLDTDFPDCRFKCIVQSSTGAMIMIPREDEKIRIYVQLSAQDNVRTSDGRLDKSALSPEEVRNKVLAGVTEGLRPYRLQFKQVFWSTIFSVPQKVATNYSFRDRIYIVGDACHTHSPKAGQGANASMGDSHNLAWKIAHVLRGWAQPSLLDTYEIERRTYAQELIEFDRRIARSLNASGTAADYQRMMHEQNMFTSGIGVRYRSPLSVPSESRFALHLSAGERLPPGPLIRLGDWEPMDLQDLAPSDGFFKIFVFPRDILVPDQNARLIQFATALGGNLDANIAEHLRSFVVMSSKKECVHWRDVPPYFQDWKCVFVSEEPGAKGLYSKIGIADEGTAILVRPDGYLSMLAELSSAGATKITTFLQQL